MHGREHVRRFLEIELDRYLSGRTREEDREVPLVRVEGQPYLYYSKGAVVLWAIRDLLGPDAMNAAIRAAMTVPRPTGTDLQRELRRAAGSNASLIDQWLNDIVLYDLRLESANARHRPDGKWDVTLRVAAAKRRADSQGNETAIPFDETIDVALDDVSQKRELHAGANDLTFTVDAPPTMAIVDPWVTRIDRNPRDNAKRVER
jgi:hypothetical protein